MVAYTKERLRDYIEFLLALETANTSFREFCGGIVSCIVRFFARYQRRCNVAKISSIGLAYWHGPWCSGCAGMASRYPAAHSSKWVVPCYYRPTVDSSIAETTQRPLLSFIGRPRLPVFAVLGSFFGHLLALSLPIIFLDSFSTYAHSKTGAALFFCPCIGALLHT